ncbi:DUF2065 domain-containing protein [Vibrio hippocampi]|uniref:DUF2065 domain-containing protein n=1 Tax=Vibrio hippocampi TaxID=654686 RepID=A0ABM8ZEK3_9VIBR|nr:DUF2065 domain-containing protein [Vibrio hippocampi]CAH0524474.1 hypothetical protein VHP8226_00310 [Vibrio hippocampi]
MTNALWIAFGLVLVVEGVGPLLAPTQWQSMVMKLSQQPSTSLRRMGGCLVVAGLVIVYMMTR